MQRTCQSLSCAHVNMTQTAIETHLPNARLVTLDTSHKLQALQRQPNPIEMIKMAPFNSGHGSPSAPTQPTSASLRPTSSFPPQPVDMAASLLLRYLEPFQRMLMWWVFLRKASSAFRAATTTSSVGAARSSARYWKGRWAARTPMFGTQASDQGLYIMILMCAPGQQDSTALPHTTGTSACCCSSPG